MIKQSIYINQSAVVSPLGEPGFNTASTFFSLQEKSLVTTISSELELELAALKKEIKLFSQVDRSVLLAILASRMLKLNSGKTAINIGSSRGATHVWEDGYSRFRETCLPSSTVDSLSPLTSPLTTLGNISTWIAQDLGIDAVAFSHSITCATASHSILNGIAWLQSGMVDQFIAGGSEAPLTAFTIEQMRSMRIYSNDTDSYPCKALDLTKKSNTMILGEAAACFLLSREKSDDCNASIIGYGASIESLNSATSVTSDGLGLQQAMRDATASFDMDSIDAIITHSPGTIKGDQAEYNAILKIFGEQHPALCNNKWQIGHTLGASGAMSVAMALQMFKEDQIYKIPYLQESVCNPRKISIPKRILINATGFGGNTVSLLLEKQS